jgi:hypothetical protein
MTSTTYNNGRLGNQIIRNLAVSLIAKKHNLKINYCNHDLINKLGINLFSGSNIYTNMYNLNDDNYFSIYNYNNLNYNLNPNNAYFQTKEITNFIYNYLHTDSVKSNIIDKNPFKMRYNNNNDLFIHIRLADVKDKNPGINYYVNTIKQVIFDKYDKYDKMYISTDERNHNIITTLLQLYPNAIMINYDEIGTFQFASTCKNIILSHGSFSAIIGYLSFFSNIYYPEYEYDKIWYGDMFSIKKFIKMPVK